MVIRWSEATAGAMYAILAMDDAGEVPSDVQLDMRRAVKRIFQERVNRNAETGGYHLPPGIIVADLYPEYPGEEKS